MEARQINMALQVGRQTIDTSLKVGEHGIFDLFMGISTLVFLHYWHLYVLVSLTLFLEGFAFL